MSTLRKWAISVPLVLLGAVLCSIVLGAVVYYWKEYTPHLEAGALGSLEALHTMQENYKASKGSYARNFAEMGIPLGAQLRGNDLTWDGGYIYTISELHFDENGSVSGYTISARPERYARGSKKSYLENQQGTIFVTTENRPANHYDRKISSENR